jgi:hypothetical protein
VALIPLLLAVGFFGPKTYLVVNLDTAEIRPYGGYVGVYGEVVLRYGRVESVSFGDTKALEDVYNARLASGELEAPYEPYPMVYAASQAPDFPTAALEIDDAYWKSTGVWADGVIGIDLHAAEALLRVIGPIQVEGEPRPVTEANFVALLLEHTQRFDGSDEDRKQFVYSLGYQTLSHVRAVPITRWPQLYSVLAEAANQRHVQLWFDQPLLQHLAAWRGWDGDFPPPSNDFLAVVDSNISFNKANLFTDQALDYRVELAADGGAVATLNVAYENRGSDSLDFPTGHMPYVHEAVYEAEIRAYVPLGSERLDSGEEVPNDQQSWEELGRTVFQEQVSVPPHSQARVTLRYRLPSRGVGAQTIDYELLVRKQAGTLGVPIAVTVVAPEGWAARGGTTREWTTTSRLTADARFGVTIEPARSG